MSKRKPEQRGKREAERLFQIGDFWLGYTPGSQTIYYHWYDAELRKVRRKTTRKTDLNEAKLWLAEYVLGAPPDDPLAPECVTIAAVRKFYMTHHGDAMRSANASKRAFTLISDYMGSLDIEGAPKVADFGVARQDAFMKWCRDKHGHASKSISTYLSYYKAGLNFAATPLLVRDAKGVEREVRVLASVPHINDGEDYVANVTGLPRSQPRSWIPQDAELAAMIDAIEHEHVFRYVVIALNTWARPEAICELNVAQQANFDRRLVNLNQIDRPQNSKIRPTIPLTDTLFGWFKTWNKEWPIHDAHGHRIGKIDNRTLQKAAKRAGIAEHEKFTRYTLRHYMATRIRRVPSIAVAREERATWMGHVDPHHRTTEAWYESFDPDYLDAPKRATDAIMASLSSMMKVRSLLPPLMQHKSGLMVVTSTNAETVAKASNDFGK